MKKILLISLIFCLSLSIFACGSVPNKANDAVLCKDPEENWYVLSADGKIFLYYYPGNESNSFTVPEGVETVDKNAFRDASLLKELRFSATVRVVENGAFESLSVERIVIPATVEQITYDFVNCPNLKELVCEAPMTDFNLIGCPALEHLILPQTITTLGVFCFEGCSAITEIRTAGQNNVSDAALEAACSGKVIYLPKGIATLSIEQMLGIGADGIYVPASVTELDLRGTGSWGRALTISVASTTSVLIDGDDYHTLLIRE